MKMTSTMRRMAAWMACLAIMLGALAPSVSHALAQARGEPSAWDICRADAGQTGKTPLGLFEHCAYCLPHAGSDGWVPPAPFVPAMLADRAVHAAPDRIAAAPVLPLAAVPARGPPALA